MLLLEVLLEVLLEDGSLADSCPDKTVPPEKQEDARAGTTQPCQVPDVWRGLEGRLAMASRVSTVRGTGVRATAPQPRSYEATKLRVQQI